MSKNDATNPTVRDECGKSVQIQFIIRSSMLFETDYIDKKKRLIEQKFVFICSSYDEMNLLYAC